MTLFLICPACEMVFMTHFIYIIWRETKYSTNKKNSRLDLFLSTGKWLDNEKCVILDLNVTLHFIVEDESLLWITGSTWEAFWQGCESWKSSSPSLEHFKVSETLLFQTCLYFIPVTFVILMLTGIKLLWYGYLIHPHFHSVPETFFSQSPEGKCGLWDISQKGKSFQRQLKTIFFFFN